MNCSYRKSIQRILKKKKYRKKWFFLQFLDFSIERYPKSISYSNSTSSNYVNPFQPELLFTSFISFAIIKSWRHLSPLFKSDLKYFEITLTLVPPWALLKKNIFLQKIFSSINQNLIYRRFGKFFDIILFTKLQKIVVISARRKIFIRLKKIKIFKKHFKLVDHIIHRQKETFLTFLKMTSVVTFL